jgi:chromosome segregation ATPase
VNDALQAAITELHKQLAAERDKSAQLTEQLVAQKSTFASKEDDLESEMLQTLEAHIATQPAPTASDSTDSTSASAELVAARAQIQSLLEQLSTTRAQLRDGADANMRIQQQWALERDRADSAWEKSQQQLAALNSELSDTKAKLQAVQSDHQNLLVAHQELEAEVRDAETRLKSMPEQLMFSGDVESSESSVSLLDGFVTVVDAPLSYSDQNANTMLVAPSPTVASAPLAPAFFASASSSARSTFDSAPSTHSSLSGATSTGATVLYSDELEPASRNGSALFSPASSGPTSLSNRIAIGIDTSSPVNLPSALDDFSPHCQLAALISALHLNIQQRATRLSAALSAAQDEIRVVRSSSSNATDEVQPLLQAARQEASSAVERLASLQRQYDALVANQSAASSAECTSCVALKTEIDRLTKEVDERQQRIAACESQLHVVDQQVSLFDAEAKQKEARLRQRIAVLEDTAKKSKNGNAAAK